VKPLKVKVSVTLDNDIVEKLKELAEKDDRSFSQYVNLLLRRQLENQKDSSKGIL
jgi:predicted transcriptional regulator